MTSQGVDFWSLRCPAGESLGRVREGLRGRRRRREEEPGHRSSSWTTTTLNRETSSGVPPAVPEIDNK